MRNVSEFTLDHEFITAKNFSMGLNSSFPGQDFNSLNSESFLSIHSTFSQENPHGEFDGELVSPDKSDLAISAAVKSQMLNSDEETVKEAEDNEPVQHKQDAIDVNEVQEEENTTIQPSTGLKNSQYFTLNFICFLHIETACVVFLYFIFLYVGGTSNGEKEDEEVKVLLYVFFFNFLIWNSIVQPI